MKAEADKVLKDAVSKGDVPGVTAAATDAREISKPRVWSEKPTGTSKCAAMVAVVAAEFIAMMITARRRVVDGSCHVEGLCPKVDGRHGEARDLAPCARLVDLRHLGALDDDHRHHEIAMAS